MNPRIILISLLFLAGCISTSSQSLDSEKALSHLQIAVSMMNRGMYPQAHAELLQAEKLDPRNASVQNNLGLASYYRQRFDLAEKYYKRAVELKSNYSEARNNLARLYVETDRLSQAEEQLKIVIDDLTYTGYSRAYLHYGVLRFKQEQYSDAIKFLSKAIETDKESCSGYYFLGRSFLERNENSRAVEALDRSVNFCDRSMEDEPLYYSALAYYRSEQKEKSLARFDALLKQFPNGKNREKAKQLVALIRKVQ